MPKSQVLVGKTSDEIAAHLRDAVGKIYAESKEQETVTIGLSGGSLPKHFAAAASQLNDVDWRKVKFVFCDERLVDVDDAESTFGVFKRIFLENSPVAGITEDSFLVVDSCLAPADAAKDYEDKIRNLFGKSIPRFDLLLLGMGPDGHTCSLFPHHDLLRERTRLVAEIIDSPKPPPCRITLTFSAINNAKNVVFVATGSGKRDALKEIFRSESSPTEDVKLKFPASNVDPTDGKLVWIVDDAAMPN